MRHKTILYKGIVPTICRQCDMRCGIYVHIEDGLIKDISGMKAHPQNRGRVCQKGVAARDTVYHDERLLKPLKRSSNGSFSEISLPRAMDEIATKIEGIKEKSGARSIGIWKGEALGFAQQEKYARRFAHALGSPNYFSCDSQCFASRYIAYCLVQGFWNPSPDFENAKAIILWGTNPPSSHPTFMAPINRARKKGGKLVAIDPRLTNIANKADLFLQIKPGSDGALAWGLIRYLIESESYDKNFVEKYSTGFTELSAYSQHFKPSFVANETGLEESDVITLAEIIRENIPHIANYVGVSLEHQENGVQTIRTIACLGGLCGAVDIPGSDLWPEQMGEQNLNLYDEIPLIELKPIGAERFPLLYDFRKECHTMTAMDYILGKGEYPLRAMLLTGANPVITNPNAEKVKEAFSKLDLFVVRDLFLTETASLAHYILPAASFLERSELSFYPHYHWVSLSRKVLHIPDVVDEYSFWKELAQRLGFAEKFFPWENEEEVNRWMLEGTSVSIEALQENHHGMQYRPITYRKYLNTPFPTPSGKFEFFSEYLADRGYEGLPLYTKPFYSRENMNKYPFTLITGARNLVFTHSRFRNIYRFSRKYPHAVVEINSQDAAGLDIKDGDKVRIKSETGEVIVKAVLMHKGEIKPGMLQVTHGWGGNSNINRLTLDNVNDPISGFPQTTSIPVNINKI
ncbi:MAG: hypothetical protein DRP87_00920 [Spirochaetes bacterium]|mgnify:CR=1 FL=1|nr:MAG: hypothetical protein DRP87_00920 [Spirochaetota bacterium]